MNELEKKILGAVQHGIPFVPNPYETLAHHIGITPDELLGVLRHWKDEKKIRRAGAIVNHFQMGHGVGAMVVWQVPEESIDEIGTLFASFAKVSHAYRRPVKKNWPYALYTMVHAVSHEELECTIQSMSYESGITDFRTLKTIQELKKVPPTYIME